MVKQGPVMVKEVHENDEDFLHKHKHHMSSQIFSRTFKVQATCRNPSFGLVIEAKGLQGCEPKESLGITSHTPGSVGKCEGVNLHTPKATPTLGDGGPVDSRNFRERFQGSKFNGLWCSLYHWKALGMYMFKMGSHCSFEHLKHKLWPKEGSRVKLLV